MTDPDGANMNFLNVRPTFHYILFFNRIWSAKSGHVALPMGFSTWRLLNSDLLYFAFLFTRSESNLLN